jgi:hypothetical protein
MKSTRYSPFNGVPSAYEYLETSRRITSVLRAKSVDEISRLDWIFILALP